MRQTAEDTPRTQQEQLAQNRRGDGQDQRNKGNHAKELCHRVNEISK